MGASRHFLDWTLPIVHAAAERLCTTWQSGLLDLSGTLIVVPTRHAGRRLREFLAVRTHERHAAVLPGPLLTADALAHSALPPAAVATRTEMLAVWTDVLRQLDLAEFAGLFPYPIEDHGDRWAGRVAESLVKLRGDVGGACLLLGDVAARLASHPDAPRWRDLARLEQRYLERLTQSGRTDPHAHARDGGTQPPQFDGVQRVIVIATPDPSPLAQRALQTLATTLPVEIWIHAPDELQDCFDEWGRPVPEAWEQRRIDLHDESIRLVGGPRDQAREALRLAEAARCDITDLVVGVPEPALVSPLQSVFAVAEHATYNPAGESAGTHPVVTFLRLLAELLQNASYEALAQVLRHPDVLAHLQRTDSTFAPARMLRQLDDAQNRHLPVLARDLTAALKSDTGMDDLARAIDWVRSQVERLHVPSATEALRTLLADLYSGCELRTPSPEATAFDAVAEAVAQALSELESPLVTSLKLPLHDQLALLLKSVRSTHVYAERMPRSIDLSGWLELAWDDGACLLLTGMNDGSVPETLVGDMFLPDSLRAQLGLPCNRSRFCRDLYLLTTMIESRRDHGQVHVILGKTNTQGDPLRPSRLLFRCPDADLPQRSRHLFSSRDETSPGAPREIPWRLQPGLAPLPRRLAVTRFRDYLACPFRFYLKHLLKMEPQHDRQLELEASDFGTICHTALRLLYEDLELRACTDPNRIAEALTTEAERIVRTRYGQHPALPVTVQLETARQRLTAAAFAHARDRAAGWEIIAVEHPIGGASGIELAGMRISGTVDRIDRHADGRLRVLDYKTADKPTQPAKAHLKKLAADSAETGWHITYVSGTPHRWIDLQLPLYAALLAPEFGPIAECGYFAMPKAVTETGLQLWSGLGPDLVQSAITCAVGIVEAVLARRFWPPAERVLYDEFEPLLFNGPLDSMDTDWLANQLGFPVAAAGEACP